MKKFKTREEWLMAAVGLLAVHFKAAEYPLPAKMRLSVSFPWQGSRSNVIGQHFPVTMSADGTHEMLIHPKLDNALEVLGILTHELCHAAAPEGSKHGRKFAKIGEALHLEGKPKFMNGGKEFAKLIGNAVIKKLGKYPHAALSSRGPGVKHQGTRLLKVECGGCGYVVRVTRTWLDCAGAPLCPSEECEQFEQPMVEAA